jgi:hypothetical protein
METYIGVKMVQAEPCSMDQFAGAKNFGDLSKLSGGKDQHGYRVVYENGYKSWSPKDVFEKAYVLDLPFKNDALVEMQPHEQRVLEEYEQLNYKHEALTSFIGKKEFEELDVEEQDLLKLQSLTMRMYLNVLGERMMKFKRK